jgi:hypothetical protein
LEDILLKAVERHADDSERIEFVIHHGDGTAGRATPTHKAGRNLFPARLARQFFPETRIRPIQVDAIHQTSSNKSIAFSYIITII